MEPHVNGCFRSVCNSKPTGRVIYAKDPFPPSKTRILDGSRRNLLTGRRQLVMNGISLIDPPVKDLGGSPSMDKSVCSRCDSDANYNTGGCFGVKCIGCNENGISDVGKIPGSNERGIRSV